MLQPGRHLFPVHCPQCVEHPDGHWTLLSVGRNAGSDEVSVRYFDALDIVNEVCVRRANQLLIWLGVEARAERTNTFRQVGEDCVWWVLHYAEVEARAEHAEGLGVCRAIGHELRKPQIRQCLKLGCEQLEAARVKWLHEQQRTEAQAEAVRKMVEKKRGLIQFCRDELDRLKRRAAVAAEALLKGAKNLPDPEVHVEKKTPNVKINETVEEALKEMDALGLAEEKEKQKEAEKQKKAEEKEKQKEAENYAHRDAWMHVCMYIHTYIHIYIYIYILCVCIGLGSGLPQMVWSGSGAG